MTGARDITARAHAWIAPALAPGAVAVDATTGNGHDTEFLAAGVGPAGIVHAFDVQASALDRARERLQRAGLVERVCWHHAGHESLREVTGEAAVTAVMFNLGWLPGGSREVITQPQTTLSALEQAATLLAADGRLSIVAYRGHAGGAEEHAAVDRWVRGGVHGLDVVLVEPASLHPTAPVLYGLMARGKPTA